MIGLQTTESFLRGTNWQAYARVEIDGTRATAVMVAAGSPVLLQGGYDYSLPDGTVAEQKEFLFTPPRAFLGSAASGPAAATARTGSEGCIAVTFCRYTQTGCELVWQLWTRLVLISPLHFGHRTVEKAIATTPNFSYAGLDKRAASAVRFLGYAGGLGRKIPRRLEFFTGQGCNDHRSGGGAAVCSWSEAEVFDDQGRGGHRCAQIYVRYICRHLEFW